MKRFALLTIFVATLFPYIADASCELKADTSGVLLVGPFYDATDGVTPETALTIEDGDILWQQPGSTTIAEEAGFSDCTHRTGGLYTCPYDETVVDTEGTAGYVINDSEAGGVFEKCLILGASFYDLKYGATSFIDCDDVGTVLGCASPITIDALTDQDTMSMSGGPISDDDLNGFEICITSAAGTDVDCTTILDYTASGNNIELASELAFTVATSDTVKVRSPGTASVEAATIRSAIGMSSANLDTQLATIDSNVDDILEDTGTTLDGKIDTLDTNVDLMMGTFLNCEVNTANFAGDSDEFACILTDLAGGGVTQASGDLEGLQIVVTSGAQIREARFINDSTWDGANSELQLQLSRALPDTLADAVTVVIR